MSCRVKTDLPLVFRSSSAKSRESEKNRKPYGRQRLGSDNRIGLGSFAGSVSHEQCPNDISRLNDYHQHQLSSETLLPDRLNDTRARQYSNSSANGPCLWAPSHRAPLKTDDRGRNEDIHDLPPSVDHQDLSKQIDKNTLLTEPNRQSSDASRYLEPNEIREEATPRRQFKSLQEREAFFKQKLEDLSISIKAATTSKQSYTLKIKWTKLW